MNFYLKWLGILLSAISLFRLGHTWLQFGLKAIFVKMFEWYGAFFAPVTSVVNFVISWPFKQIGIILPHVPDGLIVIWILTASAIIRAAFAVEGPPESRGELAIVTAKVFPLAPYFLVLMFWSEFPDYVAQLSNSVFAFLQKYFRKEKELETLAKGATVGSVSVDLGHDTQFVKEIGYVVIACLSLFALNAYGP